MALCIRLHTRLPASAPSPSSAALLLKEQLLIHGTVQTPGLLHRVCVCLCARTHVRVSLKERGHTLMSFVEYKAVLSLRRCYEGQKLAK